MEKKYEDLVNFTARMVQMFSDYLHNDVVDVDRMLNLYITRLKNEHYKLLITMSLSSLFKEEVDFNKVINKYVADVSDFIDIAACIQIILIEKEEFEKCAKILSNLKDYYISFCCFLEEDDEKLNKQDLIGEIEGLMESKINITKKIWEMD